MRYMLLQLLSIRFCFAQQQSAQSFPNPRTNGFAACGLRSRGYVCDPEKQLTEQERYRLNNDLLQLSQRTTHPHSGDFCTTKGIDATLFITRQGSQQLAQQLNTQWDADGQCKKAVVFVLSTNDHRLYYAAEEHAGITSQNFAKIVGEQQQLLNEGKYTTALTAIFKKLGTSTVPSEQPGDQGGSGDKDGTSGRRHSMSTSPYSAFSYFTVISSLVLPLILKL